jgi:hypothetical protein
MGPTTVTLSNGDVATYDEEMDRWTAPDGTVIDRGRNYDFWTQRRANERAAVMDRLRQAQELFVTMASSTEQKAAHAWLREHFSL